MVWRSCPITNLVDGASTCTICSCAVQTKTAAARPLPLSKGYAWCPGSGGSSTSRGTACLCGTASWPKCSPFNQNYIHHVTKNDSQHGHQRLPIRSMVNIPVTILPIVTDEAEQLVVLLLSPVALALLLGITTVLWFHTRAFSKLYLFQIVWCWDIFATRIVDGRKGQLASSRSTGCSILYEYLVHWCIIIEYAGHRKTEIQPPTQHNTTYVAYLRRDACSAHDRSPHTVRSRCPVASPQSD